ncbi:hypothetical protein J4450_06315 [Candidatus Micrarchaeota archaeon]|nr:hypothetical protein [Candidatus Micrarchaeota archaeon]
MRFLILALLIISSIFAQSNDTGPGGHDVVTDTPTVVIPPDSLDSCDAGFVDTLNIRALDTKLRPIEGASVTVTYQLDKSTSKGYFTTPPRLTSKNGNVTVTIRNLEKIQSQVDCDIKIDVTLDGKSFSKAITAENHPSFIDFKIDVFTLRVLVVDERNSAISGAEVFVNNRSKITEGGIADFKVFGGKSRVFVKYLGGKEESEVDVTDDLTTTVQLIFFKLKIYTTDENDDPLSTKITIDDKTYDSSGELNLDKIIGQYHTAMINYQGREKTIDLDLAENTEYSAAFDISSPKIKRVDVFEEGNKIRVVITTEDEGQFASGVAASDVSVRYISETGGTKKIAVYQNKPNQFTAEIPVPTGFNEISFTVDVKDREGNSVSAEGLHKLSGGSSSNGANGGGTGPNFPNPKNQTDGPDQPPSSDQGLPLHYIIGGIIILVVVFYVVYRLKFKKEG